MRVSILEPAKIIYEGNAIEVILSLQDGQITVLDFHQPFLCRLIKGSISIKGIWTGAAASNGKKQRSAGIDITVNGGIAKMAKDELIIIAEPL